MDRADGISLVDERSTVERPFILTTKLYIPQTHLPLVTRSHLNKQLEACLKRNLTLVSAPAGFGKTTLIANWIQKLKDDDRKDDAQNSSFAWISLDQNVNDSVRFMTYFMAGLQIIEASLGEAALDWLESSNELPIESVMAGLINDVSELAYDVILVFDDFHLITEPAIHEAAAFLLDNQPPNLHLIVISRADPPWPLARLRAR
ncbi:MAG: hypothetical protein P8183_08180, partial [Anaerolineae bacterium]